MKITVVDKFTEFNSYLASGDNDRRDNQLPINLKLPESESRILEDYAEKTGRSKTDILREFIQSLKDSLVEQTR